jgi:hypothetical protein
MLQGPESVPLGNYRSPSIENADLLKMQTVGRRFAKFAKQNVE